MRAFSCCWPVSASGPCRHCWLDVQPAGRMRLVSWQLCNLHCSATHDSARSRAPHHTNAAPPWPVAAITGASTDARRRGRRDRRVTAARRALPASTAASCALGARSSSVAYPSSGASSRPSASVSSSLSVLLPPPPPPPRPARRAILRRCVSSAACCSAWLANSNKMSSKKYCVGAAVSRPDPAHAACMHACRQAHQVLDHVHVWPHKTLTLVDVPPHVVLRDST